jgi:antitoxin (DNA-binding transcriptional repressor) of toxin-antitoxin stability system
LTYNMVMKKVNIFEAKARLSEYVDAAERGEQVVICRRNRPVAELRRVHAARTQSRPIGGAGRLPVPDAFFAELPGEVVDAFYGNPAPAASSRVAERPARRRASKSRRRR